MTSPKVSIGTLLGWFPDFLPRHIFSSHKAFHYCIPPPPPPPDNELLWLYNIAVNICEFRILLNGKMEKLEQLSCRSVT